MTAKQQVQLLFPLDCKKGYQCECCKQRVQTYSRKFNANMAYALIFMYNNRDSGFIKVEEEMRKSGKMRSGDFTYLRWYWLIEPMQEKREDGSSRNGYYRITTRGIMFVEGQLKVNERFLMFNNACQGFEGNEITIEQALGKKFNFNELMGY